jgi:hypothetical protein
MRWLQSLLDAAAMGRLEEVQALLKKGADPNHGECCAGGR